MTASTELSAETTAENESRLKAAAEQGLLIDDAILLFRKIVDRMPTTTWLLETKRLVTMEPASDFDARRKADVEEELDDLRRDLRSLAVDWVSGWYARGGFYVMKDGSLGDFRHYMNDLSPEMKALAVPGPGQEIPPQTMEQIRMAMELSAPAVVIELMKNTHLVVSDAMTYALLG
ncbi:hypothetical protein [Methylococcus sp. EFPC2]|uniref:hypothetical protein n=1 Tax=Methylococcus sp. EFPC2 TaxID=2812648 RepID=UPI001966EA84|nr:hypothetical protein [Methylococcus sp. EFPC2]QSA98332.1 hypothetical protein JWZ97_05840 [Methylococcus sp. EFPC2]